MLIAVLQQAVRGHRTQTPLPRGFACQDTDKHIGQHDADVEQYEKDLKNTTDATKADLAELTSLVSGENPTITNITHAIAELKAKVLGMNAEIKSKTAKLHEKKEAMKAMHSKIPTQSGADITDAEVLAVTNGVFKSCADVQSHGFCGLEEAAQHCGATCNTKVAKAASHQHSINAMKGGDVLNDAVDGISDATNAIDDVANDAADGVVDVAEDVADGVVEAAEVVADGISAAVNALQNEVNRLTNEITELTNQAANYLSQIGNLEGVINDVVNTVSSLPGKAQDAINMIPKLAEMFGEFVMNVITKFTQGKICEIVDSVQDFINDEILSKISVDITPSCGAPDDYETIAINHPGGKPLPIKKDGVPIQLNAFGGESNFRLMGLAKWVVNVKVHDLDFGCSELSKLPQLIEDFWRDNPIKDLMMKAVKELGEIFKIKEIIEFIKQGVDAIKGAVNAIASTFSMETKSMNAMSVSALAQHKLSLLAHLEAAHYGKPLRLHNVSELIDIGDENDPPGVYVVPLTHLHKMLNASAMQELVETHTHGVIEESFTKFMLKPEQQALLKEHEEGESHTMLAQAEGHNVSKKMFGLGTALMPIKTLWVTVTINADLNLKAERTSEGGDASRQNGNPGEFEKVWVYDMMEKVQEAIGEGLSQEIPLHPFSFISIKLAHKPKLSMPVQFHIEARGIAQLYTEAKGTSFSVNLASGTLLNLATDADIARFSGPDISGSFFKFDGSLSADLGVQFKYSSTTSAGLCFTGTGACATANMVIDYANMIGADMGVTTQTDWGVRSDCDDWMLETEQTNLVEYTESDLRDFNAALAAGGPVWGLGLWAYSTLPRIRIFPSLDMGSNMGSCKLKFNGKATSWDTVRDAAFKDMPLFDLVKSKQTSEEKEAEAARFATMKPPLVDLVKAPFLFRASFAMGGSLPRSNDCDDPSSNKYFFARPLLGDGGCADMSPSPPPPPSAPPLPPSPAPSLPPTPGTTTCAMIQGQPLSPHSTGASSEFYTTTADECADWCVAQRAEYGCEWSPPSTPNTDATPTMGKCYNVKGPITGQSPLSGWDGYGCLITKRSPSPPPPLPPPPPHPPQCLGWCYDVSYGTPQDAAYVSWTTRCGWNSPPDYMACAACPECDNLDIKTPGELGFPDSFASTEEAAAGCVAAGCTGLASSTDVLRAGVSRCAQAWASDAKGYYMHYAAAGCGSIGWNSGWGGAAGALCLCPPCDIYHCIDSGSGQCFEASSHCYDSGCANMGNWKTSVNAAYTNTYEGFQEYCKSWSANAGTFNGGQGTCAGSGIPCTGCETSCLAGATVVL